VVRSGGEWWGAAGSGGEDGPESILRLSGQLLLLQNVPVRADVIGGGAVSHGKGVVPRRGDEAGQPPLPIVILPVGDPPGALETLQER
jgi:hypothetical protein